MRDYEFVRNASVTVVDYSDIDIPVVLAFGGGIIVWLLLNAIEKERI